MSHTTDREETLPAIIIGAGQAGVALSYCLQQRGVEHLVLEMDRPLLIGTAGVGTHLR